MVKMMMIVRRLLQDTLQDEIDMSKQREEKLSYEVQHYKSVLSDTVGVFLRIFSLMS